MNFLFSAGEARAHVREIGIHDEVPAQLSIHWKLYQLQYKDQELGMSETKAGGRHNPKFFLTRRTKRVIISDRSPAIGTSSSLKTE